jgi:large subunit ribosomal protein L25
MECLSTSFSSSSNSTKSSSTNEHIVDFSGLLRPPVTDAVVIPPKYPVIEAFKREVGAGSRVSRRLRGEGYIPGVLYGHDDAGKPIKELIMVDKNQIINKFREKMASFESTLFELKVAGSEPSLVTARQLQINTVNMTPYSVNFLKYKMGAIIKIPIKMINQEKSPIIKKGYLPIRINQFINCECRVDMLPDGVTIDLAGLDEQRTFRVSDIYFPPGVKPLSTISQSTIVAVIKQLK